MLHFGLSEASATNHPPRACRSAGGGGPDRVLAHGARPGAKRRARSLRGAGHRLRPLGTGGNGYLTGRSCAHEVRPENGSSIRLRPLLPGNLAANRPVVDLLKQSRTRRTQHRPDRARLAAGAEAVDRPDPGTRNSRHLTENLGAAHVVTPADLREIETAFSKRPPDRQRPTAQPGQPWITRGPTGGVRGRRVAQCPTAPPPSRRVSDPVAADFDGLGRDLTEILNDDTSALGVGARIHPDAHVHRQLPVGARHCDLRDVQTPVRSLETLNQPPRRESMQNTVQS